MTVKERLDDQKNNWNRCFEKNEDMFGIEPSFSGEEAAKLFKEKGVKSILELGCGQGRDTLYFLKEGFEVTALDYSEQGLKDLEEKAKDLGLENRLTTKLADLREDLELEDESFDACYSHMLYCMALTIDELDRLSKEVRRVLKKGGIQAYTSRNTKDADFKKGEHLGDNLYVDGGFIIQFLDDNMVEKFSEGFKILDIVEFEEGGLPRILSLVMQEKL